MASLILCKLWFRDLRLPIVKVSKLTVPLVVGWISAIPDCRFCRSDSGVIQKKIHACTRDPFKLSDFIACACVKKNVTTRPDLTCKSNRCSFTQSCLARDQLAFHHSSQGFPLTHSACVQYLSGLPVPVTATKAFPFTHSANPLVQWNPHLAKHLPPCTPTPLKLSLAKNSLT